MMIDLADQIAVEKTDLINQNDYFSSSITLTK